MPDGSPQTVLSPATLHAALLDAGSATAVLESLCGRAVQIRRLSPDCAYGPAPRAELRVDMEETVIRRHVHLLDGRRILSEARLWYVPARLPVRLAGCLTETSEPFGRIVRGMGLRRTMLSARLHHAEAPVALEHQAMLADPAGCPVALVHERYDWAIFAGS